MELWVERYALSLESEEFPSGRTTATNDVNLCVSAAGRRHSVWISASLLGIHTVEGKGELTECVWERQTNSEVDNQELANNKYMHFNHKCG